MTAPVRYGIELDTMRELHFLEWEGLLELALRPLLISISAVFEVSVLCAGLFFSSELVKLDRGSRNESIQELISYEPLIHGCGSKEKKGLAG